MKSEVRSTNSWTGTDGHGRTRGTYFLCLLFPASSMGCWLYNGEGREFWGSGDWRFCWDNSGSSVISVLLGVKLYLRRKMNPIWAFMFR